MGIVRGVDVLHRLVGVGGGRLEDRVKGGVAILDEEIKTHNFCIQISAV